MPKVGVVLSGCGVYDGTEIQESVITMLSLNRNGADYLLMAPDVDQMHVVNHMTGEVTEGESRNVLVESARIARGNVSDIANVKANDIDALIFPGGFGGAKNLSTFATHGAEATVNDDVKRLVNEMMAERKPVGFICITPTIAAKIFEQAKVEGINLTIGNDAGTAEAIYNLGSKHIECNVDEIAVDETRKIVSAPAYMYGDASIGGVAAGIEKLVLKVLNLV